MSRFILFASMVMALAVGPVTVSAASMMKKSAAKAAVEASDLSDELAKPLAAGQDALQTLQGLGEKAKNGGHAAALVRKAEKVKADLRDALQSVRDFKAPKDEASVRDALVVALAQGLRSADLFSQGLQNDDEGRRDTGLKLASLAEADMERMKTQGAKAVGGVPGDSGPMTIGPSVGADMSLSGQTGSTNLNMGLNASVPINAATDIGGGLTMAVAASSGTGGSTSDNLNLGVNVFGRYHFLNMFENSPWIVPYVGGKMGVTLGTSSSYDGNLNFTTSDTLTRVIGIQFGTLFFVTRKMAITTQLELDGNSMTSDTSTQATSDSSYALTLGFRQMF